MRTILVRLCCLLVTITWVQAEDNAQLAQQLANPIASLISVPFQLNYDSRIGSDDNGSRWLMNIQPVWPFSLTDDWNLISRTILPVIAMDNLPSDKDQTFGLGSTIQSLFFSPVKPSASGWLWGAGPVFALPTVTDSLLGKHQWGMGPTAVALKQSGQWTYGTLINHVYLFDRQGEKSENATYIQPFMVYTTLGAVSYSFNTESTFDWRTNQWQIPLNITVAKVVKAGSQRISIGGGVRYWAYTEGQAPEDMGWRLMATWLFPR